MKLTYMYFTFFTATYFVEARVLQEGSKLLLHLDAVCSVVNDDNLVVEVVRRVEDDRRQRQHQVVEVVGATQLCSDRHFDVDHFQTSELVRVVPTAHWTRVYH